MVQEAASAPQNGAITPAVTLPRLILIGAIAGFFGGLFGLGGGVIIVPALVFLCGFNQRLAAANSSFALLPTALVSIISYALHGGVDWLAGLALAGGVFVGSRIGAAFLHRLSLRALEICFLVFLIFAIGTLWTVVPARQDTIEMNPLVFVLLILFGIIPGIGVALLGIGGGIVAIPVLIAGFGASDLIAKGTSMVMVIVGAVSASYKNVKQKTIELKIPLIIGVAAAFVSPFSVQLAVFLTPLWSNILFSVFLGFIAVQYVLRILRHGKKTA
ncbi:sulfite exporter TauE/SafE family protein [Canibacter sp. lx-72]|uniref:sulfite exporter TauE/SafE family protein n=1 Tax=Canibacter zhuwentaonis TaxID=2837491 RepID=UPI001BDC1ADC|nr:sulfite exporter TauE/SafE family protein [Canibacter zhuwentaonis]MBT1018633.1 sulfite exporter TauE/SafE family protein [Canibacter zhuwentaonis]MBT1035857.1 sulfite exporter TauE/SafE family protein [Canibacter zhuwentaonis]